MTQPLRFTDVLDDAAFFSLEHQILLDEIVGQSSWNVQLDSSPAFQFSGARDLTCTGIHLLGSAAPGPGSWLWAWANPTAYPEATIALSASVRDFGEKHGIPELYQPEVSFQSLPGSPDNPSVVAGLMIDAAKVISAHWSSFSGDAGGGTRAAFLIEHPEFVLHEPELPRVMRVIQQGLTDLRLNDPRRALYSYARQRGLISPTELVSNRVELNHPTFQIVIEFDELGRPMKINGSSSNSTA